MQNCSIVKPKSKIIIEQQVQEFLREYFPNSLNNPTPLNIDDFLFILEKYYLVKIELVESLPGNHEAKYDPYENKIYIPNETFIQAGENRNRPRFTIVHEGSHAIFHRNQIVHPDMNFLTEQLRDMITLNREIVPDYMNSEWQANYYAGCILLPRQTLFPFIANYRNRLFDKEMILPKISKTYKVSIDAAKKRYFYVFEDEKTSCLNRRFIM